MTIAKTKNKMKVYVEASSLTTQYLSGVGHVLLSTLRAWDFSDSEVILIIPFNKQSALARWDLPFKVKTIPIPDRLFRALRKWNIFPWMDVFIGKGIYLFPNYWNWPLLFSKGVTYAYDLGYTTHPEFLENKNRKFLFKHAYAWFKHSDLIVAISTFTAKELIQHYPSLKDRVAVVHCGVDLKVFTPSVDERTIEEIKKRYGIQGKYILYVGNIEPRKNLLKLIDAYEKLPVDIRKTYSLILLGGDGWHNQEIFSRITDMRKKGEKVLKIDSFVPDKDLPALYQGASAALLVSLYEGFGMTTLEAMASKTPVIVSDIASIREVVGDSGVYVNPNSIQDISDKIETLLSNSSLQEHLSEVGYARAQQFSWEKSVNELYNCLSRFKRTK